jgi:hypothetical protein
VSRSKSTESRKGAEKPRSITERELRLTAALYASRRGVVDHVRATGSLPEGFSLDGGAIGARLIVEARGTDITLTPDEQLVYEAIVRNGRPPKGSAFLMADSPWAGFALGAPRESSDE